MKLAAHDSRFPGRRSTERQNQPSCRAGKQDGGTVLK